MSDGRQQPRFLRGLPAAHPQYPHVLLAHGGGGRLMHQLLEEVFGKAFGNPILDARHDRRAFEPCARRPAGLHHRLLRGAPAVFPGGDIGSHGGPRHGQRPGHERRAPAVFELRASSSRKGLPMETLWRVVCSMRDAARKCGVQHRHRRHQGGGQGQGRRPVHQHHGHRRDRTRPAILPQSVRPGDAILVSGDLGRHGMAIMAVREGLAI